MLDCDLKPVLEIGYFDPYELIGELRSGRQVLVICDNPFEVSKRVVDLESEWRFVRHKPLAQLKHTCGATVYFIKDASGYRGGADTIYLLGCQTAANMDRIHIFKNQNPYVMVRRLRP